MLGVVLWRDKTDENALIWCEDHGDLAVCMRKGQAEQPSLHVGDCVQFDLALDADVRLARNPRIVQEQMYPDIADRLKTVTDTPKAAETRTGGNVVSFADVRARRSANQRSLQPA
ncbi:hypothetical protein [Chachezhania antarctica]|uniref:hypothetical protein n=1 Tax=Chachezhania antarctica TaxID=2340860 RepID=UPI000EAF848B|nr:hypothetical protein [Chachezhania antarctica]|tara:strand:+ start:2565 stop:2909 length:345 start_codon:yes stop_codon:yes gene_type:complete